MNTIQIEGISFTPSQTVLENIQYLKQEFGTIFENLKRQLDTTFETSDQISIENLIQETETQLEKVKDSSKTYREKYAIFQQLNKAWFNIQQTYKDNPRAINLIRCIDHLSNYSIAYSSLCLSLSLINEERAGKYETDLERIVQGFLLLAQTMDVFVAFFSIPELHQIYDGAKNAIAISAQTVTEYFEQTPEVSNLITQLKAYSSLIILKLEKYVPDSALASKPTVAHSHNEVEEDSSSSPWWEQITGTFADSSIYDEAMHLGREYRNSFRSTSTASDE